MWWPFGRKYPERCPQDVDSREFDYVIAGGGTAGCALASRLSEDPNVSVLLLERGPANDTWISRVPIVSSNILKSDGGASSWNCEPMKYCDNRKSLFFRGEVLGGGSRINGMVYTRGTPADYDAWAALGHPEWSYEKVLPYFVKGEKALDKPKLSYRGDSGTWITRSFIYATWLFNVYRVFSDAAEAMGFPRVPDTAAPDAPADGLATLDSTIDENNRRVSTFDAFLPREVALKREKNLAICTMAIVSRIVFSGQEEKGKPRVKKVLFKLTDPKSDKVWSVKVKKEVIVCSGSIGSPQVLMLSGIGPRAHLEENGIEVVHDLPGVGSELTDHHGVPVAWEVPINESLTAVAVSPVLKGGLEFLKYLIWGTGILGNPVQILSLFVRSSSLAKGGTEFRSDMPARPSKDSPEAAISNPQDYVPDIELMPIATSAMDDLEEHNRLFSKIGAFSLLASHVQPKSRGTVRLSSSNPHDQPKVDFGILSDPADYVVLRAAVRLSLKLGEAMKASGFPLLQNLVFTEEAQQRDIDNGNDDELDKYIRRRVRTLYHYTSSCRMAPENDPKAPGVVDDELRVYGVDGLRVCDTSVFPQIVSAHVQAPAVMVAERCADFIKKLK